MLGRWQEPSEAPVELKETLRDALCKCDQMKTAATQAGPEDRAVFSDLHELFEQICRGVVRHQNREAS
jgi:hypothetical protein